MSSSGSGIGY